MQEKQLIVVSATRYFQGGTIVIVNECLKFLAENLSQKYRIKALVYKKELYTNLPEIEFLEFPKARAGIVYRLYHEYVYFKKLSKKWKPKLWLSMQDSTPNVIADIRAVYFHNSFLQIKRPYNVFKNQPKLWYIWLLYKTIYTKNISKNDFIIIQQETMAKLLMQRHNLLQEKIIIAHPTTKYYESNANHENGIFSFIYPATAFAYKNFEIIFKACECINKSKLNYKIDLTISGDENNYTKSLKNKYNLSQIVWNGFINQQEVFKKYDTADCMIFPSLTEAWGLPLSEFAIQNKPIICADLPYAKETLANYNKVKFFNPYDAENLAMLMLQAMNNELVFDDNSFEHTMPVINNWVEMFDKILS